MDKTRIFKSIQDVHDYAKTKQVVQYSIVSDDGSTGDGITKYFIDDTCPLISNFEDCVFTTK